MHGSSKRLSVAWLVPLAMCTGVAAWFVAEPAAVHTVAGPDPVAILHVDTDPAWSATFDDAAPSAGCSCRHDAPLP